MWYKTKEEILSELPNSEILSEHEGELVVTYYKSRDLMSMAYFYAHGEDKTRFYSDQDAGASFDKEEAKKMLSYLNKFIEDPS